jgi:hypothetical protein
VTHEPDEIRRRYRRFAEVECRGYSDLYDRLARAVAVDDEVIGFLTALPVVQPNLFFAAVQLLTGPDDMPRTGTALRALLRRRGPAIAEVMRARRTQTNEVGRCAVLLPALPSGPLALVEVGASAGLCLLLDRFSYEFGAHRIGDPSSSVRLRCALTGPAPLPAAPPPVVWRCGLDVEPIDVHDEAAVDWLLACVWADHADRRRRLVAAVDAARARPPVVKAGDLVDDLAAVLAEAPADTTLVVFHSAVLSYVSPARRQAFAARLAAASMQRDVVWLSNEAPGVVPEVTALAPRPADRSFLLGRTQFLNRTRRDEFLGLAHPHGATLTWQREDRVS